MTYDHDAPGLPANWLNGWLAAIGITVIVDDCKLSWTNDVVPHAILQAGVDLPDTIARALLANDLQTTVIATERPDCQHKFTRKVSLDSYRERAQYERRTGSNLLATSVSDLSDRADLGNLNHGAFDPPAPKGTTLYTRALACDEHLRTVDNAARLISRTLAGKAHRIQTNGLGFDSRRLATGVQPGSLASGKVHIDPVVELLCLHAITMFPTRGDGHNIRQRRWTDRTTQRGAFTWPIWQTPLDRWAIDAILDNTTIAPAAYRSVPYQPSSPSDTTRAYAAERIT